MKKNNTNGPIGPRSSLLALAILGLTPLVQAQESISGGEFRKDHSDPDIYSQVSMVNNFAQWLPVGGTFTPLLTAWDSDDGDLTARIIQTSGVDTGTPGQYTANYEVTDNGQPAEEDFAEVPAYTSTFTLQVTVYDPAVEQPQNTVKLALLWQEPAMVENSQILIAPGGTLSRSFRIEGNKLPLLGETLQITTFQVKEAVWGGNNRQFAIVLTDIESGQPIFNGPVTFESGTTFSLPTPVSLQANKYYGFTLHYLAGPDNQGFRLNEKSQLWLTASGQQEQKIYPYAQVLPDPTNALAFDPGLASPIKEKMLSSHGGNEKLFIRKLAGAEQNLTYVIKDPGLANMQVQPGVQQDTLVLSGLAAGETDLEIQANGELVDKVRLIVTTPKEVTLSYSYIAFPDEAYTHLWDDGSLIQSEVTRRYAPYNIQIKWVDHGILVHEWDKDGDGHAYEEDRSELEAPINEGWIPNAEQVFSNLYVVRGHKDPSQPCSSSGNASSIGYGEADIPPRAGYRWACPGNFTEQGQAITLTHELGHNFGLFHPNDSDSYKESNIMYGGRKEGVFFAPQWRTIHQTILTRMAAGDEGVSEIIKKQAEPQK